MADQITTVSQLETLYDRPSRNSLVKVAQHITPEYGAWIGASRFCILSTVGADGTDGSPRGDEDPVAWIQDPQTLLMPDWRGNNRLDSLRNIVEDGRVSLMFMVPGDANVVRINGQAGPDLPSMGDILQAQTAGEAEQSARIDSAAYEKDWRARVTKSLW